MTYKEKYEALVAEIKRLKDETAIGLNEWENGVENGRMEIINALNEKINFMQKEPVTNEVNEEILILKDKIESLHAAMICKDELLKVKLENQKQEMMKTAVEGKIYETQVRSRLKATTTGYISHFDYKVGDKVKILIFKEE